MGRRRNLIVAGVALGVTLSLAPAVFAETYSVGPGLVGVGTNGSDSAAGGGHSAVAVTHGGGCARGTLAAAAIGPGCGATTYYIGGDGNPSVTVGLLGAPSNGREVAVSDTGPAGSCTNGCWPIGVAASVGGDVSAPYNIFAVGASGLGDVESQWVAISGTGDASGGAVAVSGTGHAEGPIAVGGGDLLP